MTENTQAQIQNLLESDLLGRMRRNHGLEHATLHMLAKRYPRQSLAGHSSPTGFWIVGEVSTDDLRAAVSEALERLQNGERALAVHPNCGTNFVTTGVLAGLAGALAMFSATLTLILTQPLGLKLQERVTTSGDPGDLRVVEIIPTKRGRLKAHRVVTQG